MRYKVSQEDSKEPFMLWTPPPSHWWPNCMSWAKHRRRKAAAKLHLRLNLQSFLPGYAVIEEASHHDDTRAPELCAHLQDGEIALFDKAYINFTHIYNLALRGVFG